jgi:hypothetical protein
MQSRSQPSSRGQRSRLRSSLQLSRCSSTRCTTREQPLRERWRGAKHYCSSNRICLAGLAQDKSAGSARRIRCLLFPTHRPSVLSKFVRCSVLRVSVECWSSKCQRHTSSTLPPTVSHARVISFISRVLSDNRHDCIFRPARFSTCCDSAIFIEPSD